VSTNTLFASCKCMDSILVFLQWLFVTNVKQRHQHYSVESQEPLLQESNRFTREHNSFLGPNEPINLLQCSKLQPAAEVPYVQGVVMAQVGQVPALPPHLQNMTRYFLMHELTAAQTNTIQAAYGELMGVQPQDAAGVRRTKVARFFTSRGG
jgi:hypothetical protein